MYFPYFLGPLHSFCSIFGTSHYSLEIPVVNSLSLSLYLFTLSLSFSLLFPLHPFLSFSVFDHRQGDWARFSSLHPSNNFFLSICVVETQTERERERKKKRRNFNWRYFYVFVCSFVRLYSFLTRNDLFESMSSFFNHFMGEGGRKRRGVQVSKGSFFCCSFLSRFNSENVQSVFFLALVEKKIRNE